jgi:hypothetical protein
MFFLIVLSTALFVLISCGGTTAHLCFEFSWWLPWISLWNEAWVVQLMVILVFYFMLFSANAYNTLFYLFLQLFITGLQLSFYQVELFTAFLWVVELTVILVCLLLLFFLNVSGLRPYFKINLFSNLLAIFFIVILIIAAYIYGGADTEGTTFILAQAFYIWEDYYEALLLVASNDVASLSVSYYSINNLELVLVGFLLLIGSVICVNLNKYQRGDKNSKVSGDMTLLNIFNHLANSVFVRKQNMVSQNILKASLNIFKKNKKNKKTKVN